ncbi:hypothetical protein MTY59_25700 [Mycobacterium senriense]|uniref:Uncharacterized protein n=1 Tax=Mycobacterium senriense TaxID=2775496 RepID=A0ABM7SR60_9MYCO|nr:hypothetical protein MTY59_25700 [Mycobacterium senriense]
MDDRVFAADRANRQFTDVQLVADVDFATGRAKLGGGLRIGVKRRIRVTLKQCRQPFGVDMVGMLMGDQDGRQAGDSLESVREGTGVEEQAGVVELGK